MAALNLGAAAVVSVGSTSPTFLLIKDSAMTGVFGLICLITLFATPRPLMFYFAQRFNGGGAPRRRRTSTTCGKRSPASGVGSGS